MSAMLTTVPSMRPMRLLQLWLVRACLLVCLSMTVGCQFAPQQPLTWPWDKQQTKKQPERVLPVWTDTVLYQTNQPGIRGFGGRIYFYEQDAAEPIEVEGGLAVYVFDADNDLPQAQKPLRKFVFTAEQFSQHMSRTSIGPSYSVWLPWGEVGGPPQRLSLIARFEGSQGGTVISDPTIKLLPGIPVNTTEVAQPSPLAANSGVQLASHAQSSQPHPLQALSGSAAATASAELTRRSVGTIDLPPSFQRHLRAPTFAGDINRSQGSLSTDTLGPSPLPVGQLPLDTLPLNSPSGTSVAAAATVANTSSATVPSATQSPLQSVSTGPHGSSTGPQRINASGPSRTEPANYGGSRGSRDIRHGSWIQGIAR